MGEDDQLGMMDEDGTVWATRRNGKKLERTVLEMNSEIAANEMDGTILKSEHVPESEEVGILS